MSYSKEYMIPCTFDDTVQSMKFIPMSNANFLATGGWDCRIRIFDIKYNVMNINTNNEDCQINANLQFGYEHSSPILSLSWDGNQGRLFTGCADGSINMIDIAKKTSNQISTHQGACREVIFHQNYNILLTGGWDGVINLFDLRTPNPTFTYKFPNRVYSMSCVRDLFVVGLSELKIAYFNLGKLQMNKSFQPDLFFSSHLKYQTRKVCVFHDGKGFAESSIEGRVAIKHIININNPPQINQETGTTMGKDEFGKDDFAFRCHRNTKTTPQEVYSVNDIAFNPVYGTFCTAGSDGIYCIWDRINRSRLFERTEINDKTPLTCCDYNSTGNLLAFACGYDWSRGADEAKNYTNSTKVGIHYLPPNQRKK